MMDRVVGTCSLCGGQVTLPGIWSGVVPPVPQCSSCHATAKSSGPVIEMERPRTAANFVLTDSRTYPIKVSE